MRSNDKFYKHKIKHFSFRFYKRGAKKVILGSEWLTAVFKLEVPFSL